VGAWGSGRDVRDEAAAQDRSRKRAAAPLRCFVGVGGPEDTCFAINGWQNVQWTSNSAFTIDDTTMAMGTY